MSVNPHALSFRASVQSLPCWLRAMAFCLLLAAASAAPSSADTVYTYTGSDFTSWTNTACPAACNITGSLTLAQALGTGLSFSDVNPVSFSFTDGITTWTDLNAPGGIFEFSTDMSGVITFWAVSLGKTETPSQCDPGSADLRFLKMEQLSTFSTNLADAICATDTALTTTYEAENSSSGTWVPSDGVSPVPEPSSFILVGTGLAATLWRRRVSRKSAGTTQASLDRVA
jgi:hypothetical protein